MIRATLLLAAAGAGYLLPVAQTPPPSPAIPLWIGLVIAWATLSTRVGKPARGSTPRRSPTLSPSRWTVLLAGSIAMILPVIEWRVRAYPGTSSMAVGQWIGVVLALSGLALRIASRIAVVNRAETNGLMWPRCGPYSVLRHPDHTGALLAVAGHALLYAATYSFLASLLLMMLALSLHVRATESEMDYLYGDAYRRYAEKTSRLVPRVW